MTLTFSSILRVLFWLTIAAVVLVSVTPGAQLPQVNLWDKLQHGLAYGTLAVLGSLGYRRPGQMLQIVLGCIILGAVLEGVQTVVPGRSSELADAIANGLGALLGGTVALALRRFLPLPA